MVNPANTLMWLRYYDTECLFISFSAEQYLNRVSDAGIHRWVVSARIFSHFVEGLISTFLAIFLECRNDDKIYAVLVKNKILLENLDVEVLYFEFGIYAGQF